MYAKEHIPFVFLVENTTYQIKLPTLELDNIPNSLFVLNCSLQAKNLSHE